MSRPLRVEYTGALYHVTARGNERRPIFRDDVDRETEGVNAESLRLPIRASPPRQLVDCNG